MRPPLTLTWRSRSAAPGGHRGLARQRGHEEDRQVPEAAGGAGEHRRVRGPRFPDEGTHQAGQDHQDISQVRRPPGAIPLPGEPIVFLTVFF